MTDLWLLVILLGSFVLTFGLVWLVDTVNSKEVPR